MSSWPSGYQVPGNACCGACKDGNAAVMLFVCLVALLLHLDALARCRRCVSDGIVQVIQQVVLLLLLAAGPA
jgi:hypothetical protein